MGVFAFFYKFLVGSGNVETCPDEDYEPISDQDFINKLKAVVADEGLLDFYTNNHWDEYVESRYDFTDDEAYILALESGYLAAVYDEVIEAPDVSVSALVENCYDEDPQNLREKAFYKFSEHATFPEYEEELKPCESLIEEDEPEETVIAEEPETDESDVEEATTRPAEVNEVSTGAVRPGGGYLTAVSIPAPVVIQKPIQKAPPTTRGHATLDEILGGTDGHPRPYYEQTVGTDSFGKRSDWKRMRGSNRKYRK
jgi:hypothetical protein